MFLRLQISLIPVSGLTSHSIDIPHKFNFVEENLTLYIIFTAQLLVDDGMLSWNGK